MGQLTGELDESLHVIGEIAKAYGRSVSDKTDIPQLGTVHAVFYIAEDVFDKQRTVDFIVLASLETSPSGRFL